MTCRSGSIGLEGILVYPGFFLQLRRRYYLSSALGPSPIYVRFTHSCCECKRLTVHPCSAVMVVAALIFVLGIDLVKEALWDTRHRVSRLDPLSCGALPLIKFVGQDGIRDDREHHGRDDRLGLRHRRLLRYHRQLFLLRRPKLAASERASALHGRERRLDSAQAKQPPRIHPRGCAADDDHAPPRSVRATFPSDPRRSSTLLMHTSGRALTGFLFFGTITHVEETIRTLVDGPAWQRSPIRFLVLDFSLVAGVDMSAAEAFVRVHRILSTRGVVLCFCGIAAGSPVCSALASVGLLEAEGVKLFASFNDALECESPDSAGSQHLLCSSVYGF
jgi:sulfate permease, SulP family